MISALDLRRKYISFYENFRNYIWSFPVIEHLADLEIAIFSACPDIIEIRNILKIIKFDMRDALEEKDEDLDASFEELSDLADESEETYYKISQVNEVHE